MGAQMARVIDENSKVPLRVMWYLGIAAVSAASWLTMLSFQTANANATAKQANDSISAIQADRALHHDRYTDAVIEFNKRLDTVEQSQKDIIDLIKTIHQ